MGRNRQLVRCLRLRVLLGRGWWQLATLARELEVTERTVRRDLDALVEAHEPIRKRHSHDDGLALWSVGA